MYRTQQYNSSSFGMQQGLTPGITFLLVANVVIFAILKLLPSVNMVPLFGLTPWEIIHRVTLWQLVTYMFLHGGFMHLFFNMLSLWMFGTDLERQWGTREFLKFYFISGAGAGVITFLVMLNSKVPVIGASGAIFAVLVAYAVLYPNRIVYIWFLIPVKVKYLVIGMIALGILAAWTQTEPGIAHFTHLGGALVGYLYLKQDFRMAALLRPWKRYRFSRRTKSARKENQKVRELMDEVDRVLDRINEVGGYDRLSDKEKKVLENASKELSQRKD
jgi:membrane associated rhomboid family serine protease